MFSSSFFFVLFECYVIIIEQLKKGKPRTFRPAAALTPVRRSTRVSDRPTVSYKEVRDAMFDFWANMQWWCNWKYLLFSRSYQWKLWREPEGLLPEFFCLKDWGLEILVDVFMQLWLCNSYVFVMFICIVEATVTEGEVLGFMLLVKRGRMQLIKQNKFSHVWELISQVF
jgi:hypothetical protein